MSDIDKVNRLHDLMFEEATFLFKDMPSWQIFEIKSRIAQMVEKRGGKIFRISMRWAEHWGIYGRSCGKFIFVSEGLERWREIGILAHEAAHFYDLIRRFRQNKKMDIYRTHEAIQEMSLEMRLAVDDAAIPVQIEITQEAMRVDKEKNGDTEPRLWREAYADRFAIRLMMFLARQYKNNEGCI